MSNTNISNTNKVPSRSELAIADTWNLESIYPTCADWEADFAKCKAMIPQILAYKGKLAESAESLLAALKLRDQIQVILGNIYTYASMRLHEDMSVTAHQALASRAETLDVDISSAISFMVPELLGAEPSLLEGFLKENSPTGAELRVYEKLFNDLHRQRPHVHNAEIEKLLAEVSEIAQGSQRVFEMLNNADLKLPMIKDENGQDKQLTQGNFSSYFLESSDRSVRQSAFTGMFSTYQTMRNTLAVNYAGQVKKNIFFARAKNYGSSLEAALKPNNIPTGVYDNLLATVESNLPKLHRYLALRKRLLGVEKLGVSDLYVPMVKDVDYKISHAEARVKCLEALAPLGKDYVEALRKGYESRWVDVCENKGKRPGAYSWGSYSSAPFMLLNWQDNLVNMFTLIHESGHSMHSYYTRKTQPACYGSYTIFVAEVASICNEMLLAHYLLKSTSDKALKMYIINHVLNSFRTTLYRQALFAEFERDAHARAEVGEALTPELLCSIYKGLNQKYYGAVVDLEDLIEIEWARIPHFYDSFYVYQYATGLAAAVSLSRQIIAEGEPAVKRYLGFLCGGSSKDSLDLLEGAGVDLSSPAPVQQALDIFESYIDEFEKLLSD